MAASMRNVCGCGTSLLFRALSNGITFQHCVRNTKTTLHLRKDWYCLWSNLVRRERKTFVTSVCHPGQPRCLPGNATIYTRADVSVSVRNSSSFFTPVSLYSFPCKHRTPSFCQLFRPCILSNQAYMIQTESSKTTADDTHDLTDKSGRNHAGRTAKNQVHEVEGRSINNGKLEKKENIKTIPNLLTTLRMASTPLLGYLVVCENFGWALALFAVAGITDLLDGYIARNFANQISALGSALDPLADKLLVTILTISMTSVGLIPLPLTGLIVFRDISLIIGGFYIRYRSLPPPITLSRYFDISHATVSVSPTSISKINTGLQLILVAGSLAAPVFGFLDHACLQALWYTTGVTTFLSGADYLWSWKKYVKLLEKDQTEL